MERSQDILGSKFISKMDMVTQVLSNLNMALQHVQGAVHSHSNAGVASTARMNRGVRKY